MVEPFIDKAIGIETKKQVNAGKIIDFAQQSQYHIYQKEGEIVASYRAGYIISVIIWIGFFI